MTFRFEAQGCSLRATLSLSSSAELFSLTCLAFLLPGIVMGAGASTMPPEMTWQTRQQAASTTAGTAENAVETAKVVADGAAGAVVTLAQVLSQVQVK